MRLSSSPDDNATIVLPKGRLLGYDDRLDAARERAGGAASNATARDSPAFISGETAGSRGAYPHASRGIRHIEFEQLLAFGNRIVGFITATIAEIAIINSNFSFYFGLRFLQMGFGYLSSS